MPGWLHHALTIFGTGIFYAACTGGAAWFTFKMAMRRLQREEDEREAERLQWIETFLGERAE